MLTAAREHRGSTAARLARRAHLRELMRAGATHGSTRAPQGPERLRARILDLFASSSYRPPLLPAVAMKVLELSRREDATAAELVKLVALDPLLAGRVLQVAQSPLYASRSPVLTLSQAALRLGVSALRDVVLEAALAIRIFRAPGFDTVMERLRHHSTVVAHLARGIAARAGVDPEVAFACGLLHDVGIAAALLAATEGDGAAGGLAWSALEPVVHEVHEEASGLVTRLWSLPAEIHEVVGRHHILRAPVAPLVPVLVVADQLAWELDAGLTRCPAPSEGLELVPAFPPPGALDANPRRVFEAACQALGLDGPATAEVRAGALRAFHAGLGGAP